MITIVISDDAEQIADKFAVATVYVVGRWGLVVADATSSIDEWFCSFARAFKCVFDVGVDDSGDDVNNCGARAYVIA